MAMEKRGIIDSETPQPDKRCEQKPCDGKQTKQAADAQEASLVTRMAETAEQCCGVTPSRR